MIAKKLSVENKIFETPKRPAFISDVNMCLSNHTKESEREFTRKNSQRSASKEKLVRCEQYLPYPQKGKLGQQ